MKTTLLHLKRFLESEEGNKIKHKPITYNVGKRAKYKKTRALKRQLDQESYTDGNLKEARDEDEPSVSDNEEQNIQNIKENEPEPSLVKPATPPQLKSEPEVMRPSMENLNRRDQKAYVKQQYDEQDRMVNHGMNFIPNHPYYEHEVENRTRISYNYKGYQDIEAPFVMPRYDMPPQFYPRDYYTFPEYHHRYSHIGLHGLNMKILPFEMILNERSFDLIKANDQVHLNGLAGVIRYQSQLRNSGDVMLMPVKVYRSCNPRVISGHRRLEGYPPRHIVEQSDSYSLEQSNKTRSNRNLPLPRGFENIT